MQMPKGVPVATVAIGNAANAGLLAVRILACSDSALQKKMLQYQVSIPQRPVMDSNVAEVISAVLIRLNLTYSLQGVARLFVPCTHDCCFGCMSMSLR